MALKKEEMVAKTFGAELEPLGDPSGGVLYIKDHKLNKVVEVKMGKNKMPECNDENPKYLQFAWALQTIPKLQKNS